MLLCHQTGCTSFPGIRTVNNIVYPTCRAACEALGLLQDDREWEVTLQEAALTATPAELRALLAHIFAYCLHIDNSDLEDYTLYEFETCLNHCSKSVTDFGLRSPPRHLMSVIRNRLLMEEKSYDRQLLATERDKLLPKLNENQRQIFNLIVNAYLNNEQQLVFVYGHGGTGKTFLWKTILYTLRCERKIVLVVASSGITSLLLPSGQTAHSRFKIPLDLTDTSVCAIKKNTELADLLKETCLIVWDESPMNDRRCFKTLYRTLRDILNQPDHLFGGKTVMLVGDFRQTLPVKRGASRNETIRSSIAHSYLWPHFKIYHLTKNMRLNNQSLSEIDKHKTAMFAQWLLDVGNGQIGIPDDSDPDNTSWVDIPDEYCIPNDDNGIPNLINFIYDADTLHHPSAEKLQEKAIICPKNDTADIINDRILSLLTTTTRTYLSYDDAIPHTHDGGEIELLYPKEYLNSLSFPGLPPHKLTLKVGSPIMLLRNMNIAGGLCNGTRLIVSQLLPKVIEARIITGTRINQKVFLPRILLTVKDPRTPFIFRRKQFPVKVCYAMTINKAQGQSLKKIGIYLADPVFGHGQLYVALSRATTPDGVKILINSQNDKPPNTVYKDFLSQINNQQILQLMATTNYLDTLAATKDKMIAIEPQVLDIASLKPADSNKIIEVIVYRKWVSKYPHTRQAIRFCCILLDRQGTPIQANIDAKDTDYFDQLLQLHSAYRITGFSCEQTIPWERTLDNPTSLTFGKFMSLQEIPNDDFPEHYFNFAAYNELPVKVNVQNPVLTGLQLSGTSATHYYLNPNMPETYHIKQYQVSQSTPPEIENPTEAPKASQPSNPKKPSARKALFKDTSEDVYPVFADPYISTQADGAQSSRVPVPLPEDPYEAIRQAYLDGTHTESEPIEDPVETETPESPLTVAPPTSLPESTPPTLVPILRRTARMAVRVPPVMSSGLSASMAEVAAMSESAFRKRFRSSYESSPSSSPPDLPSRKRYRGTSELVEDSGEDDDDEEEEIEESLDSDSVSEDAEDEGPIAEDEDPAAGDEGPGMDDEGHDMDDESHGLDDESRGLDDEGYSVESDGFGLEEEVVPGGQQQAAPVVGTVVSTPLGLGSAQSTERQETRSGCRL
ncbi:DNA helicase [Tanacetum coccineum]